MVTRTITNQIPLHQGRGARGTTMMATTIITTTVITTTTPPPDATIMITTIMLAATTITPIVITTNTGLMTNGPLFNLIPNMKHGNTQCGMTPSTT